MSRRIIFATGNAHKVQELTGMIGDQDITIVSLKDIGFAEDIPETGDTFHENALIKAQHIYNIYGGEVISEDSGLVVEALDGAPGIYSARYAGGDCTAEDNIDLLLKNLGDTENRQAYFKAVICHIQEGEPQYYEGEVNGSIARFQSGAGGFGYDPIFIPDGYEVSFAVLPAEIKKSISHRAIAVQKLAKNL